MLEEELDGPVLREHNGLEEGVPDVLETSQSSHLADNRLASRILPVAFRPVVLNLPQAATL